MRHVSRRRQMGQVRSSDLLGNLSQPGREMLFTLVKVDDEMLGANDLKLQQRVDGPAHHRSREQCQSDRDGRKKLSWPQTQRARRP